MTKQQDYRIDLIIEPTDYGYVSRVRYSPFGPASAPFNFSITRRELHSLLTSLHAAVRNNEDGRGHLLDELKTWGHRLFDAVFNDEVLTCYRESKKLADEAGHDFRVQLDLTEMPELATLPWEYMYDSFRQEFVSIAAGTVFTRYSGMMQRVLPPERDGALRALVVIPSPEGHPEIDVQRRWISLLDRVDHLAQEGLLTIEWLQKPTLFDLQKQLRNNEYHILHIMCHGTVDPATGEGQLLFEDEMGHARTVAGSHLGHLLRDHYAMRLVLLSGADISQENLLENGFIDVSEQLIRRGISAVLSTPTQLPLKERIEFMARFYAEVAALTPVDKAAALARAHLRESSLWWGAPVVQTRTPDGNLFAERAYPLDMLTEAAEENIAFRMNTLRIRTASAEAMTRWSQELAESRIRRRTEKE